MEKASLRKNLESPEFHQNLFSVVPASFMEQLSQLTGQRGEHALHYVQKQSPGGFNTLNKSITSIPMTTPKDSTMIRIMVVEDNVDYRTVIALAIDDAADMELIGLFGTTEIALRTLETTSESDQPDILLLDLRLPGMSGLDALPLIHAASPTTRVIILSQSDAPSDIVQAISSGVSGYLLKGARLQEITDAIRTVSQGGGSLDKNVAQFILEKMTTKAL
ncbi:MAG TPA: hypothetical protein DD662_00605, partial [Planctomycetaceae bacterium]|nr:hypothetical protein [Planctomycetaceae bacterium]